MKRSIICLVVMVAILAVTGVAMSQQQYKLPNGDYLGMYQEENGYGIFKPHVWQTATTLTPGKSTKMVRKTENYEKTVSAPNLDPKCNNFKGYLKSTITENRKSTEEVEQGSSVVHANSGSNPSFLGYVGIGFGGGAASWVSSPWGGNNGGTSFVNANTNENRVDPTIAPVMTATGGNATAKGGNAVAKLRSNIEVPTKISVNQENPINIKGGGGHKSGPPKNRPPCNRPPNNRPPCK